MVPNIGQISSVVVAVPVAESVVATLPEPVEPVAEAWEIRLVKAAAARLGRSFPQKPRHKVIEELLDGLMEEKQSRQLQNLNHWPEHGPRFLEALAQRWRVQEAARLERIPAVLAAKHEGALKLAFAITDNLPDADEAVAQSDFEFLTDAVKEDFYPLAVKRNSLDIVRDREGHGVVPLEGAFDGSDDGGEETVDILLHRLQSEPVAAGSDGKDPLRILLDRKSRHLARTQRSKAKKKAATDGKHRWVKQKLWGQKLGIGAKIGNDSPRSSDY
ncbi:MAG: hypothetical protein HY921_12090 [Elusimicrobia bacterium]|nr:hypothetical protein [Elusimicrobiota bacterium]